MGDDGSLCQVCNAPRSNLDHDSSVNHRFNFLKWSYNNYRKALANNRHGLKLTVEAQQINNFHFDFQHVKGKYKTKVSPEQLQLHNCSITFKCGIENTRKDAVYVMNADLMHDSPYFRLVHSFDFDLIKLGPGKAYNFGVVFTTDVLTCASYKIPVFCDIQTIANTKQDEHKGKDEVQCFTIARSFLVVVDDQIESKAKKTKSPFTSEPWSGVQTIVPTTKETYYTDEYPIPGKYRKLLTYGLERFDGMKIHEEDNLRDLLFLLESLREDNYNRFWHIVLWLEERAHECMLTKYNMAGVTMLLQRGILIVEVPGLSEKRPSVIVGDFIKIRISGDHTAYKGFVCRVNERTVEISHVDEDLLEQLADIPDLEMDVSFMLSRLSFERMHQAVDRLVQTGMVKQLFPPNRITIRANAAHELHSSQFFNESVAHNSEQKDAVNKILNCLHNYPYIVFGPPGTGKTITIVEAILQIKKRTTKKILVCAPANSACDMLAIKLMQHCSNKELIRIHSNTRERTTITEELKEYSNMIEDEFTRVTIEDLLSYRIVVTTLTLIGRFARSYRPDCVFVDEAAQASEPETGIAVSLATVGKQVVLAGDPKQLGPMATKAAAKFGLGVSLLERLMTYDIYKPRGASGTYDNHFITMLRLNFRSHPDILLLPNRLFYGNLLKAVSLIPQRDPIGNIAIYPKIKKPGAKVEGRAIEFCSVSSKDKREGKSPSYFNLFEVKMVVNYVRAVIKLNLAQAYKVKVDQIGVVTPYKRQVHKIHDALKNNGFSGVEVGTTESFQGREKRIIIISTVRAQHSLLLVDKKYNLGFVGNDQRFNVALTRAISKLIIIGCPLVLRTDDKWTQYMELCEGYGTYFGNSFAKDSQEFRENVVARTNHFKYKDDQYNN